MSLNVASCLVLTFFNSSFRHQICTQNGGPLKKKNMSSKTTFRLMFYINRSRPTKNGDCPINMRITINGESLAMFTKRYVQPDVWDGKLGMCKGKSAEANEVNRYIEAFKANVYNKYAELNSSFGQATPELMRDAILCVNTGKSKTLCVVWEDHTHDLKLLVGKETSQANYQKYCTSLKWMKQFLMEEYKMHDVPMQLINHHMVRKFEVYLLTKRMCNHNTTIKYLQNFKRIVMIGFKNGWVKINPFADYKLTLREVDRPYLTEKELQNIINLEISIPRLEIVRDLFVFSCFSGLAYIDLFQLKASELEFASNGILWIRTRRQKTKVKAQIPLLAEATFIIEKYCDLTVLKAEERVFPVLSNQKTNAYLKEIQTLVGLEKILTFHVARHTFATTVTMMNGVPIESVSRMLGHKDIKSTQHYARIVDTKIGNDMMDLASRIGSRLSFPAGYK